MDIKKILATEFSLSLFIVENIMTLIDEGNTIPFIARYRKEKTNTMDDQTLREFSERLQALNNLESKKVDIIKKIDEQGKLTKQISHSIEIAMTLTSLDDIYLPFKKTKRTRAMIAIEKGLEPLADIIFAQYPNKKDIYELAKAYINKDLDVNTCDDAIKGALDIIAAKIATNAFIRMKIRTYIYNEGYIVVKGIKNKDEDEDRNTYDMYKEYEEKIRSIAPHRVLAINRGEKEKFLKVKVDIDEANVLGIIYRAIINRNAKSAPLVAQAAQDGYSRLIFPAIQREVRNELTSLAQDNAINVFAINLKNLLMQPPVKDMVTLGLDPAYRTGCKIAVVNETGKVLDTTVVYPTPPHNKIDESSIIIGKLVKKYNIKAVAIGNGTASRESEEFIAQLINENNLDLSYMVVNEAGASVYSASKEASKEFPEYDLTLRSAISIARRLQDPLAELIKIDPKSIGVGQYQHDLAKAKLDKSLSGVVEACVNLVGVDLNTASEKLLSHVAGIGPSVAKNIISFRDEKGRFTSRAQLLKVSKLGAKAYEQCAGFLRINDAKNPLDSTGVHPESYKSTMLILKACGYSKTNLSNNTIKEINKEVQSIGYADLAQSIGIGIPTLKDIISELEQPGRDPRSNLPPALMHKDVLDIDSLYEGMELKGTVRNVVDFGAFVDIGVHQDGLVHISKISNRFLKHPSEVVKVGDVVDVTVISVDKNRKRIALSMVK